MSNFQFQHSDSIKKDIFQDIPWYYSKAFVWILLLSIGPIGLPWLFKSPKFTQTSKWVITILILSISLLPFYLGYYFHRLINNPEDLKAFLNILFNAEDSKLILNFLQLLKH